MELNGIVYMSFGAKAGAAIAKSIASLRKTGLKYPICVVGDTPVAGTQFVKWEGESPYDAKQRNNFQFRAGRVKPLLYGCSPFERTLYVDADTVFMKSIEEGFGYLDEFDMAVTEEKLTLGGLYNKKLAGWEINIRERDVTIDETGGDAKRKFINSGVVFFKKSAQIEKLFCDWHTEWVRFQEWDEQLALMRAIHTNQDVTIKCLSVKWNNPQLDSGTFIYHAYGRGVVRTNMTLAKATNKKTAGAAGSETRAEQITEPRTEQKRISDVEAVEVARVVRPLTEINERECVARLASEVVPNGIIFEIGCLYGGMTAVMGLANPRASLITIDDFSWHPADDVATSAELLYANMQKVGVKNVELIQGDSREIGKNWSSPIDLLWIDGGHSFDYVYQDICNFGIHAEVIALHDYGNPAWTSIRQAVEKFIAGHAGWRIDEVVGTVVVLRK